MYRSQTIQIQLYKRLIWLIRKHPYTPALIYFKREKIQLSRPLNCQKQWPKKLKIWHHFHALYSQQISSHMLVAKDNFFLFHLCRGQFGRGPIDMLVAKWSKCWQSESTCQTLWSLPFSAARTAKQKNAINPLKLRINISSKRV